MTKARWLAGIIALLLTGIAVGCAAPAAPTASYRVELASDPNPPRAGQAATLRARVTDQSGGPVAGAKVSMQREHLDAAHERPVTDGAEVEPGVYSARANFSMSGRWKVTVTAESPEGRTQQDFEIQVQ